MAAWQAGQNGMQQEMRMMSQNNQLMKSELIIPYIRKATLVALAVGSLVNMILVICGIVYPVPQWNSAGGLFEIRATLNASLSKRSVDVSLPEVPELPRLRLFGRGQAKYLTEDDQLTEYWDQDCQCFSTYTSTQIDTVHATKTHRSTLTVTGTSTSPSTTTSSSPSATATADSNTTSQVVAGSFSGLWLGAMGGCLQRRSGVLVCTASSFMPNFARIYGEAGLNTNVTLQMPGGTSGASIGLLVSIISFAMTMASFAFSMSPALLAFGPQNYAGHVDMRHTYFITFATLMGAVAFFSVIGSTVTLRNAFNGSAEGVEAWDPSKTLQAKLLSAFNLLYAAAIISGGVLLVGLSLIAMDFRRPWWFRQVQEGELWAAQNADVAPLPAPAMQPVPATPGTTHYAMSNFGTPHGFGVGGFR